MARHEGKWLDSLRRKPVADWKKDLQTCGAGRESQKPNVGHGQESKWEMSVYTNLTVLVSIWQKQQGTGEEKV